VTVFVDTNVLVYARDRSEADKQRRAAEWILNLWETGLGRLSYQVIQEYYVTLTSKLDPPRSTEDAREDVTALGAWSPVSIDQRTIEGAWDIQDRYGYSWWDSLIVAAALQSGCRYLLTEDLQAGQAIETMTIISPFVEEPEKILSRL
jgi:predicted nucleic acid-binding protein